MNISIPGLTLFMMLGIGLSQSTHTVQKTSPVLGGEPTVVITPVPVTEIRQHSSPEIGEAGAEMPQSPSSGTVQGTAPQIISNPWPEKHLQEEPKQ